MIWKIFDKKNVPYLVIIGLLIYIFMFGGSEVIEVKIPSKENSFEIKDPKPEIRIDTVEVPVNIKGKIIYKDSIVEVENPVNKELLHKYQKAVQEKDSLQQMKIFKEAIKERIYSETFKDSVQTITVKSEVIGTLKSQSVSYKTKEQNLKIRTGRTRPSIYFGGFTNLPTVPEASVSVGVQISVANKNSIFNAGIDNQKNIFVGYVIKLF